MNKRVVVAMSGGVDSSVAAALLKKQGYEVIGITMCFNLSESPKKRPICCGMQGIEDARGVAHKLGIRHYVLNMQKDLEKWVVKDFFKEYLKGRTPNPCVRCNQYLKFDLLLKKALSLDARLLATGHYARIKKNQNYILKKAKDKTKDQSYFLYRISQGQLRHIIFPLGNLLKVEVRELAREFDLPVSEKLASQEICFLPDNDYRGFLIRRLSWMKNNAPHLLRQVGITADIQPGLIVDKQGNILGQHRGIAFYTIGQREGLGIAKGYPLYISKIDPRKNEITVGRKDDVYSREFFIKEPHFISEPLKKKVAARVRIRYNHREARADIVLLKNKIKVCFRKPQFAVTPGQSAVFYDKDIVLGGGIIGKVLN
jgi:tRNA-specific 2-thiouridylase